MSAESSWSSREGTSTELSHVYMEHPPLRFNLKGASGVMYDEGTRQLLVSSQNKIYAWPVPQLPSSLPPRVSFISDGPVLAVKYSIDQRILAVQRTLLEIELVTRDSGAWRLKCCKGADRILGFFWATTPGCDFVLVTPIGLELYSVKLPSGSVRLVEFKRLPVSWYAYTHESRLLLLAAGPHSLTLVGFQFATVGVMKLPKFEVTLARGGRLAPPALAPDDLHIVVMYGRLYCVVVDRVALQLRIYRLFSDAIIAQVSMVIYSPRIAISVVDNVLLVHQTDARVVLLFDPLTNSPHPIASPLPLTIRKRPFLASQPLSQPSRPAAMAAKEETVKDGGSSEVQQAATVRADSVGGGERGGLEGESDGELDEGPSSSAGVSSPSEEAYGEGWVYAPPNIILDHAHGTLWLLKLDLQAIAASCSDLCVLLAFLQRRRSDPAKAKALSIETLRNIITERSPLPAVAAAFDIVFGTYLSAMPSAVRKRRQPSPMQGPGGSFPVAAAGGTLGIGALAFAAMASSPGMQAASLAASVMSAEQKSGDDWQRREQGSEQRERGGIMGGVQVAGNGEDAESSAGEEETAAGEGGAARDAGFVEERGGGEKEKAAGSGGDGGSSALSPAISPEEVVQEVLMVEEERHVPAAYLKAVVIELLNSLATVGLAAPLALHMLLVRLLLSEDQPHELWQLLHAQVIEPSVEVAKLLLAEGGGNEALQKAGLGMLQRVQAHQDYLEALMERGRIFQALRYARQHQIDKVDCELYLKAAAASGSSQKLAAVLRFCLDYVASFRGSPSHVAFSSVLQCQLAQEVV